MSNTQLKLAHKELLAECEQYRLHLYSEKFPPHFPDQSSHGLEQELRVFRIELENKLKNAKQKETNLSTIRDQLKPEHQHQISEELNAVKNNIKLLEDLLKENDPIALVKSAMDKKLCMDRYHIEDSGMIMATLRVAVDKLTALQAIEEHLRENTPDSLQKATNAYNSNLKTFLVNTDSKAIQILKNIGHLLATIVTGSIYAIGYAAYSFKKHNTAAFWRSPEERLDAKVKNATANTQNKAEAFSPSS